MLWIAAGFKLSWKKGARGQQVRWIGAVVKQWLSPTGVTGVSLTMPQDKVDCIAAQCDEMLGQERISKARLRQFTGLVTWVAGILPQVSVYTGMLWAALAAAKFSWVDIKLVTRPLKWLRKLCRDKWQSVERHIRSVPPYFTVVTFDGSLTGGGALAQFGVKTLEDLHSSPIVAFLSVQWTDDDLQMVRAKRGDPAGQARLEALALVTALNTWAKILQGAQGALVVRGDALGILYDVLRFRARDSVLNDLAGEMSLITAPWGIDLRAVHIWSQRNSICDHLSRLAPAEVPQLKALQGVTESRPVRIVPTLLER